MEKIILHCDCNSFFASVEAVLEPSLRGRAFAVCGDPALRHGIVLAKSEAAKKSGVSTGEAIWQAKKKCPELLIVKPTYGAYDEYSQRVFNIYCRYTDLVEPFGIDECWLDVSGTAHFFGTGRQIADELRRVVREETGLTISAGVSFNKIFAKLGSDYKKPDATTEITREGFKEFVYPLPASDMIGVGPAVLRRLRSIGVFTIGDIAAAAPDTLRAVLGKYGEELYACANGTEASPVKSSEYKRKYKSIGNGMTFEHDLTQDSEIRTRVFMLADKVAGRLRKHGFECTTLQVTVKSPDLTSVQHQSVLERPTQLSGELAAAALKLISEMREPDEPIRAITLTGIELCEEHGSGEQISFFFMDEQLSRFKQERLESVKDEIRGEYGKKSLVMCSLLDAESVV